MSESHVRDAPQLLTYPDSLGGDLSTLRALLEGRLAGLFGGVHVLPPFPSSGDRGFAPLTYSELDPRFGTWADIEALARDHDVLLDVMVNHISRQSPEFRDLERHGRASASADLFLTLDKVWPAGAPPASDVARLFLRNTNGPFSDLTVGRTGETIRFWTTFGTPGGFEQVDLDLASPGTRRLVTSWFAGLASHGVRIVRLDAVGYVVKRPGTTCFMVEPDIWQVLDWLRGAAADVGLAVLPEVHDAYATHERLTAHGYRTYDFVLPGLVLHAFETGQAARLAAHLERSPARQFTTLDCHDGIPVSPDLEGILEPVDMLRLADVVIERGGNVNRMLVDAPVDGVDVHQLNCTYYSALGENDDRYLAARAIQLFARGIPQVYYVGLLAGANDHEAVTSTGEGRAINRHDYSAVEIDVALARPLVRDLLGLLRLRAEHPAFRGPLSVELLDRSRLRLVRRAGGDMVVLDVDLVSGGMDLRL
jgi:sucrose phosphorylase